MDHEITCQWKGNLAFEADSQGHRILIDAQPEAGGENKGASPKRLLLVGAAGCSGIDVASLIKKMRLEVDEFDIHVGGNLTDEMPKYYDTIHLTYRFKGANLNKEKLARAVELSWEKYCGVTAMLKKAAKMSYEIVYEAP